MINGYLQHLLSAQPCEVSQGSNRFLHWRTGGEGILELTPLRVDSGDSLIVSAGIHGNETAPAEILSRIVDELLSGLRPLRQRLLIIYGNPAALRSGQRFTAYDLNRLFSGYRSNAPDCYESQRAGELEQAVTTFCRQRMEVSRCWHLDLHTALRESFYPQFGVLPANSRPWSQDFLDWLGAAALRALVFHQTPGGTFSHYTCAIHGAESCTLELGKARPFGHNRLEDFSAVSQALQSLICGDCALSPLPSQPVLRFHVVQQITRLSDEFSLYMADDTVNFTLFPRGTLLASDGSHRYYSEHPDGERVLFPNPRVACGLRAGLMLAEER